MPASRIRRYSATWEELQSRPSTERITAYRDQTFGLQWTGTKPYFPAQPWLAPSLLSGEDWDRFQDPSEYTYFKYVTRRDASSQILDSWLSIGSDLVAGVSDEWRTTWDHVFGPFKFAQAALATQASANSSYIKSSYENFFLVFESFDDLNVVYRTVEIARIVRNGSRDVEPRSVWRGAAYFQAMRTLLDEIASLDDPYESLTVNQLLIRPVLSSAYYPILRSWSRAHGDYLSAQVFGLLDEDMQWHIAAGAELLGARVSDDPANGARIARWVEKWRPRVIEAVRTIVEESGRRLGRDGDAAKLIADAEQATAGAATGDLSGRVGSAREGRG